MHEQNVRDFPQTKLYREIDATFLLNEHPCFFLVFVKNSVIKNIGYLKKEESLIVVQGVFWPRRGLQANH